MKANELRLGNYVDLGSRIAKIIEISHLSCVVVDLEETQDTIESYERTKPIPLTEEWLLKFGFDEDIKEGNHSDFWVYKKDGLTFNSSHGWWYINQPLRIRPNHVHQLQNLYFALTGEELTLKS